MQEKMANRSRSLDLIKNKKLTELTRQDKKKKENIFMVGITAWTGLEVKTNLLAFELPGAVVQNNWDQPI